MNAGLATAAPQLPPGPQPSVAPGASTASTKPASEGFGTHLAKAVAVKVPARTPVADKPAVHAVDRKPDRSAGVAKAEHSASKSEKSDDPSMKAEKAAPDAPGRGQDASAQTQAAALVLPQAQNQAQNQAPAAQTASTGPDQSVTTAVAIEPVGDGVSGSGQPMPLAQAQLLKDAAQQGVTGQAGSGQIDLTQNDAAAADISQGTSGADPAALDALKSSLATNAPSSPASEGQPTPADPTASPAPATPGANPTAQIQQAQIQQAQIQLAQADLLQTQAVQSAVQDQGAAADQGQPDLSPAGKTASPTTSSTKSANLVADSKAGKSESAAGAIQVADSPAMVFAAAGKSGDQSSANTDNPGAGSDKGAGLATSADGKVVAPAAAPAPAAPQIAVPAPVHIAPQTLQTAAVVMKAGPATVAGLVDHIVSKFDGATTRFDVELHPQDLGRVDVRLEVGASGQISAAMSFDNPQAAAEMRARSADLQKALENAGFNLNGGLSFDVAGDRSQGGSRNPGSEPGLAQRSRALETATSAAADLADAAMINSRGAYGARPDRGVDIRI